MRNQLQNQRRLKTGGISIIALLFAAGTAQAAPLFESQGNAKASEKAHIQSQQDVRINRGALNQPTLEFNLDGRAVTAVRTRQIRGEKGNMTWVGHIQSSPAEGVIITARGNVFSGVIQSSFGTYEIAGEQNRLQSLEKIDLSALPQEDVGMSEDVLNHVDSTTSAVAGDMIQQDIMVVYTQDACDQAANVSSGSDCSQLEADIVTTFAQMNQAYIDSDINIFSNLTSMRLLAGYVETSSLPLGALQSTTDGIMDEVHGWRDEDGADLVHMVQKNSGCGVAYTSINATVGFAVTAENCMLGNRTFAHETGHNQNALHDRMQHSGGTVGGYRYGYRRCNDNGSEDVGAPYFRTVMAYSCSGAPRVGIFSNPNRSDFAGVPEGIDPDVNPNLGAYNARRINETAAAVAAYRESATPPTPPAAPSGLSASASGPDAINLSWADNADNENGFAIERSTDNVNFSEIASVGSNVTSFNDNGLSAETTYYYRVEANNASGASGYSNTASATTDSLPTSVDHVAQSQTATTGTVSGSFSDTHTDNGSVQTITEVSSGGPKRRRKQSYSHTYSFDVLGGAGGVVLNANAYVSGSEGANFDYSSDGGASWNSMFTVSSNASGNMQSYAFPGGTSGAILVRVTDAAQTNGEAADSVSIDSLIITSNTVAGSPPASPSGLSVTGSTSSSVSLSYTDNSSDEFGFEIWRGTASGVCGTGDLVGTASADQASFTDGTTSAATTYFYDVSAYNGGGSSGCAGEVSATTGAAPAITASGNGYKVKGKQKVDVTWSGAAGSDVDIYRGSVIITTANDGAETDNIDLKGGATYIYKVCENGTSACSPEFTITF